MAATRRDLTIDDLTALHWIADPQLSPDGTRVAFTRVWKENPIRPRRSPTSSRACPAGSS